MTTHPPSHVTVERVVTDDDHAVVLYVDDQVVIALNPPVATALAEQLDEAAAEPDLCDVTNCDNYVNRDDGLCDHHGALEDNRTGADT